MIFNKDKSRTILLISCCDLILKFELTFATLKLKTKAFTFQKALQYLYLDDERIVKVKSEVSWNMVLCLFTLVERLFCWFAGLCITFPSRFLIRFVWNHHPIKLFVETNYLFQPVILQLQSMEKQSGKDKRFIKGMKRMGQAMHCQLTRLCSW